MEQVTEFVGPSIPHHIEQELGDFKQASRDPSLVPIFPMSRRLRSHVCYESQQFYESEWDDHHVAIADRQGRVVALACFMFRNRCLYVGELSTRKNTRGFGRKIISALVSIAAREKKKYIVLHSLPEAVGFYTHLGFLVKLRHETNQVSSRSYPKTRRRSPRRSTTTRKLVIRVRKYQKS